MASRSARRRSLSSAFVLAGSMLLCRLVSFADCCGSGERARLVLGLDFDGESTGDGEWSDCVRDNRGLRFMEAIKSRNCPRINAKK
jgi:hypothetical protein